jgi:hypothetical protein
MPGHVIKQHVNAGKDFDGTAPVGAPVIDTDKIKSYPREDAGGEFMPGACTVKNITLKGGGGQGDVEFIHHEDGVGEHQIFAVTTPAKEVSWKGELAIGDYDKIIAKTQHGSKKMSCSIYFED